jgi:hypothetical protein
MENLPHTVTSKVRISSVNIPACPLACKGLSFSRMKKLAAAATWLDIVRLFFKERY